MEDAKSGGVTSGVEPVQMDTDAKVEAPKKKVKKTNVPVSELVYGGMLPADVPKAVEKEFEMRNKLHDKYQKFVTQPEMEELIAKLQDVEDRLYEDGEDETNGVYVAKLEELKMHGDPIEERYKEFSERGPALDQLIYCINSYRDAALSNDSKFDLIDNSEKQKVVNECVEAEAWLGEKRQLKESLPKYATPAVLTSDIKR